MSTAQLADEQHPWIGLAPFTESDCEFFAGRGDEIDELLRLVRRDTLTLLYGVSGLGKTSLLQAGLFPALRAEDYLPVPIRLDHVDGAPPLAKQVLFAITKASDEASVEAPVPLPGEALWEYFHRESNHFWSPRNDLVTPFLVFDQFEECFTLGRETSGREQRGAAFISELADLVENRPPAALRGDPQRAREFSFKPRPLRVLLAMREDYLAELDRIRSQFRALGQNRLRLLPMGMPQAGQVIDLGASLIAPGVEDRIVRFVAGSATNADDGEITVAPALLSLVLQQLNERRLEQGADAKITAELLDLQQKKIFEDFYLRTLKPLDPGVRTFIEDRLLTASGFRNSCALDDALSCPGVSQPVLDELVNSRLLAYEDRHRVRRVEITHDVLAPVIRASRDSRISREALAKAERQKAEAQAKERATRRGLAFVTALLAFAVAAAIYGFWQAKLARDARSEADRQRREAVAQKTEADRQRREALAQKAEAERQRGEAEKQQAAAETARTSAQESRNNAVAAKRDADELINFMQYDLSDTLGTVGRLDMMDAINARIRKYHKDHPPEAGHLDALREQTVSLGQQGDILRDEGKLGPALKSYRDGLAIFEELAKQEPGNAGSQRDLSVSYNKVGDVQSAQGDLAGALKSYRDSLAIREKLAKQDPRNAGLQRDLSVSYNKVGDVQSAQGDLAGALKSYRDSLAIFEKFAKQDPDNAGWQADLAFSYWRTGTRLARSDAQSKKDARTMVEKGRDILRALKTRIGLTRQQQQWLDSMEADVRKW
jgi:tetratricopeptide (TPR) repeat protein